MGTTYSAVRIDQEVEMTDRLQELGYIYYRGCARTIQSCDGKAARAGRAVSQEDRRAVRGCARQSLGCAWLCRLCRAAPEIVSEAEYSGPSRRIRRFWASGPAR